MKVGVRKPSLKKSIKARTTGKAKRAIKKATIPGYGQKGMGYINNPKRAAYNKVYNKTTAGVNDLINDKSNNNRNTEGNSVGGAIFIGFILTFFLLFVIMSILY